MTLTAILKNQRTGRYHPIYFTRCPMAIVKDHELPAQRYCSTGHDVDGYATLAEARGHLRQSWEYRDTGFVWNWSGDRTPWMTIFYGPN